MLNECVIEKRSYTVSEVAQILDCSKKKAYNECSITKNFIVKRFGPRCIRIHKESFDEWFNSREEFST